VHFKRPIIEGVWLPATTGNRLDTAVIYIGGDADVTMTEALVTANNASTSIAVDGDAHLTVESSSFTRNLGDPGGAIYSLGSSVSEITNSSFADNHSRDVGGALAPMACSHVTVSSSSFNNNSAVLAGGAIYVDGEVTLLLQDSTLHHNSAAEGGAIFSHDRSVLQLDTTSIINNAAPDSADTTGTGGGLYMISNGILELSQTIVSSNTAQQGGGVFLDDSITIDPAALTASVVKNIATVTDNDLSTNPTSLEVLGDRYISGFVAGSDEDAGLLNVQLLLTGRDGLIPCGKQRVEAYWQSGSSSTQNTTTARELPTSDCDEDTVPALPKAHARSLPNGTVNFALRFRQPPGNHTIVFKALPEGWCGVSTNITVNVRACKLGEREVGKGASSVC
jgi:predicted outer membrane repeat protein